MTSSEHDDLIAFLNERDAARPVRKLHRLPLDTYSAEEGVCFFTLCARHCGEPFRDAELAGAVFDALLWRKRREGWSLFCYCLMPDHLHFVAQLPECAADDGSTVVRRRVRESILDQVGDFKKYTTT